MNEVYEKIILLIVGAMLTGVLVPVVKFTFDKMQFAAKTKLEDSIRRHTQVLEARAEAIVEVSNALWEYQQLHKKLAYYGANQMQSETKDAWTEYETSGWELLLSLRTLIGGMRWLLTQDEHRQLLGSYYDWKDELQENCPDESRDANDTKKWLVYNSWIDDVSSKKIDLLIGKLADQFSLPNGVQ